MEAVWVCVLPDRTCGGQPEGALQLPQKPQELLRYARTSPNMQAVQGTEQADHTCVCPFLTLAGPAQHVCVHSALSASPHVPGVSLLATG